MKLFIRIHTGVIIYGDKRIQNQRYKPLVPLDFARALPPWIDYIKKILRLSTIQKSVSGQCFFTPWTNREQSGKSRQKPLPPVGYIHAAIACIGMNL